MLEKRHYDEQNVIIKIGEPIKSILIVAKGSAVCMIDTLYNFTALEILEEGSNYGAISAIREAESKSKYQLVAFTNITVYLLSE